MAWYGIFDYEGGINTESCLEACTLSLYACMCVYVYLWILYCITVKM